MISKKCFCEIMTALKNLEDRVTKLIDLKLLPIENVWDEDIAEIEEALSKELEPDTDEETISLCGYLLEAFIFDYDWGTNYENGYLVKFDDVEYRPKTFEELYNGFIALNSRQENE